ncbi:hypothetical protein ABPG72_012680 [Tetrahymena utriculariae]
MIEEEYSYITALDVELKEEDQAAIGFILPHEHIFQNLSQFADQNLVDFDSISLFNIQQIRDQPFRCNRNLNLDSVEEMHFEMQELISHPVYKNKKPLIVEATNNQNGQDYAKLKQLAKLLKINLVKGFTFGKDLSKIDLNDEKTKVLFSSQNILNQVDFEFELGTNEQKPSYIGEIELSELNLESNLVHQNALIAYLHISKVKKVPIIFNLKNQPTPNIEKLISQMKPEHVGRIVLFNPQFEYEEKRLVIEKENEQNLTLVKQIKNFKEILILLNQKFILGFDILRYEYNDLVDITKLLLQKGYSKQILISNGVKYRTDLRKYGGKGFFAVFDFIKDTQMNDQQIEDIFRNNMIAVLQWNTFKVQIQEIKQWKCPICGKEQPENIQRFTKLGKEFCSIACLKKAVF